MLNGILAGRDTELVQFLQGDRLPPKQVARVEAHLRANRTHWEAMASQPVVLDADAHLAAQVAHLRTKVVPEAAEAARDLINTIGRLEEKIARLQAELDRIPDEERIAAARQALEEARRGHAGKMGEIDALRLRREVLERQRTEAVARIDRMGEKDHDARMAEDARHRMLRHSKRVRETLGKFRTNVVCRHIANMEVLMLESFRNLLRKEDLVCALAIHPETFEVTLSDRDGRPLPFDRLSAGERQLLATSLLWGLARASGRPIPTIIDTPLGRLDSSHRRHLVERYFPHASHQVVLLSTDEEVVGPYLKSLAPAVARSYLLHHDEAAAQTSIQSGYFQQHEAAR